MLLKLTGFVHHNFILAEISSMITSGIDLS